MIYFVRAGSYVKIGYAIDPRKRIPELAVGNPVDLVVLGVMPGEASDERILHRKFSEHRVRGEWFYLRSEIARFVEKNCRPLVFEKRTAQDARKSESREARSGAIVRSLAEDIRSGRATGSQREMARTFNVGRTTVQRAQKLAGELVEMH